MYEILVPRLVTQVYSWQCVSGLKMGQMTWTIRVTWVTFLVGQVGLICKLNCLDVTQIFNRSHVLWTKTLASDKQVNLWVW